MIHVTRAVAVNGPGHPHLTRQDLYDGLVRKADDALPTSPL